MPHIKPIHQGYRRVQMARVVTWWILGYLLGTVIAVITQGKTRTFNTQMKELLAERLYETYCQAVGGKAFNGDQLPKWSEFTVDPSKAKQYSAWRVVAEDMEKLIVFSSADPYVSPTNTYHCGKSVVKKSSLDEPLCVGVEDAQLVIRIGIGTLAWSSKKRNGGVIPNKLKIVDKTQFAEDVANELKREDEIGNTMLCDLLDKAMQHAMDNGSSGIGYPPSTRLK